MHFVPHTKKLLTLVLCSLSLNACRKSSDGVALFIDNKTDKQLHYAISKTYPDTSLPVSPDELRSLPPSESASKTFLRSSWAELFKEIPGDTLQVFIIDHDTLLKYSWDDIRANYKIQKRYDLSEEDLVRSKSTITYP